MTLGQKSTREVVLPSEIGIPEAETLRAELLACMNSEQHVTISATEVRRIGMAGLQVLASFARSQKTSGGTWVLREPTTALRDAARCLGLEELLGGTPA